jgi:hypothetical protein
MGAAIVGNGTAGGQTIKIFLASPSDVEAERNALSGLIREVNDVLAFLAPDRSLRLELLRYETYTYPDIGQAQEVINRQIPTEYDIFIGVMWKRCGTPTASSQSGTIEEFQRALARRENTGRPVIMFYFCDEPIPIPTPEELEQLAKVVRFRADLNSKGYTLSYPTRTEFRDHVRGGLLRAVADLLAGPTEKAQAFEAAPKPADEDRAAIERLANEYDEIRRTMPSSDERTGKMSDIAAALRLRAAAVRSLLSDYQRSSSPGLRLAAICVLQQFPAIVELDWLAERLDPEKEAPFVGYAAAVALAQAVRSLPVSDHSSLEKSITRALVLGERNPHDPSRINVLKTALEELKSKVAMRQTNVAPVYDERSRLSMAKR